MSVIGFCSAKHSPGVTTSALAIATALGKSAVLVEADPAGGDLAAALQLSTETGLLSTPVSMRNANDASISDHVQTHDGRQLLIGPTDPTQMTNVLQATGAAVINAARSEYSTVLVDLGRLSSQGVHPLNALLDHLIVVMRPTLNAVDHLRVRLDRLPETAELLVVGRTPYAPVEVSKVLNRNLNGVLPDSQRDVELLLQHSTSRAFTRSSLSRTSTEIAHQLTNSAFPLNDHANFDRLVS